MSFKAFAPTDDDTLVAQTEIDAPRPRANEAFVAVEAFAVNRGEILLLPAGRQGGHGKDIAGHVIRAAGDGTGPGAGTRVVAHLERDGWAQEVVVSVARLVPLPDHVSTEITAALPLAG